MDCRQIKGVSLKFFVEREEELIAGRMGVID